MNERSGYCHVLGRAKRAVSLAIIQHEILNHLTWECLQSDGVVRIQKILWVGERTYEHQVDVVGRDERDCVFATI